MAKVFISNLSPLQKYESAKEYGELVVLTRGNMPIFKTQALQEAINNGLETSDEEDYLIISGSAVIGALTMSGWLIRHPKCRLLLYDKSEDAYSLRVINRDDYGQRATKGNSQANSAAA